MKKIIICLFAVLFLTGCGVSENQKLDTNDNVENSINSYDTSSMDYMEKYIYNLSSNADRTIFLGFWHQSITYAKSIQLELKGISNTNSYTFDPTNSSEIPSEISNIFDFSSIKRRSGFDKHQNFKLTINGTDVKLSYDGIEFFPTKYSYSEVQELVEKYNKN